MLKHVQISPIRSRAESLSIRSNTSCASSICGSPEPPLDSFPRTPSRASSYTSLADNVPQTTMKIYTSCLHQDIEYKTLCIAWDTSSRDVVSQVLRRCKMRHRDPRLFFLSMEVTVRRAGVRTVLNLDDDARPALLQACQPKGDSRFYLQLKPGGLIRVHTSVLQPSSQYKSLMISEVTTSDEILALLLSCYNLNEPVEQYSLYEVCPGQEYQRKLHPDDLPLRTQMQRNQKGEQCHFLVRKNPNYPRRRQMLPSVVERRNSGALDAQTHKSNYNLNAAIVATVADGKRRSTPIEGHWRMFDDNNNNNSSSSSSGQNNHSADELNSLTLASECLEDAVCAKCKNNFKSCEFCNKNMITTLWSPSLTRSSSTASSASTNSSFSSTSTSSSSSVQISASAAAAQRIAAAAGAGAATTAAMTAKPKLYNPVYSIREIRTVCNSFSSLGIDKKLFDIEKRPNFSHCSISTKNNHVREEINTDPARGVGNFLYI